MLTALVRTTDRVVIATWAGAPVSPVAPDDCEWIELTRELYEKLADVVAPNGSFLNRLLPDGTKERNLHTRHFYAHVRKSDRAILSLGRTIPDFLRDGMETVEIPQANFIAIQEGNNLHHDSAEQVPAWSISESGVVAPIPDTRPVLEVAQLGSGVIGFVLKDSNKDESVVILLRGEDTRKHIRIDLERGKKTVTPSLAAGRYELVPADSTAYRMTGDTVLEVYETWA